MAGLLFAPAVLLALVTSLCGIVSVLVERREAARRLAAPLRRQPFRPVIVAGSRAAPGHFRLAQTPLRSRQGAATNDNAGRSTLADKK